MGGDITVNDSFRPVSRFFDRVSYPEHLLTALPEACRVLTDQADTGAVTISFHQDTEGEAWDFPVRFFEPRVWYIPRRPPAEEQIARAAELIRASERPFLIAGGGIRYSRAGAAVAEFSEHFGVPVGETFAGKASVPVGPYHLGAVGVTGTGGANAMASRADLVICVGTRLQDFTNRFQFPLPEPGSAVCRYKCRRPRRLQTGRRTDCGRRQTVGGEAQRDSETGRLDSERRVPNPDHSRGPSLGRPDGPPPGTSTGTDHEPG